MPVYRITAPDGQSYEVTAPEGATEQDVLSYAQANYTSAAPAPEPEQDSAWDFSGDRTIFGRGEEMARGFGRSALSSLGTFAEGVEGLTDYLPARKVAEYATEKAAGFLGFGDEYEKGKEAIAAAPERFTRYINEDSVLKADEKYKDLWTTSLAEGAGSLLTIAAASLANPGLGWATAVSMGSGQQQQAMRRAEEQGEDISEGERLYGTVFGGAVGALDMVPIGTILKPLKGIPKNIPIADKEKIVGLMSRALTSEPVKAGLEEGTQEVVSSVLQNLVEMGYNPNAELPTAESLWNDFSVGAFLGTGARMLSDAAAGHRNTVMGKMELERERKAREREEANFALAGQQLRADAERRAAIDTDPTVFAQEAAARQREAITVPPPSEEEVKAFNSPSVTGAAFTPSSFGELYAYRIIGKLGKFFPTNTTFSVMQKDNGFSVVDANGNQYGQDIPDQRAANAVATNLNREVPESGIRSAILDTLKSSPQAVSEQDFEPMYRYGYRALSPETGRVTFASLNDAAGTTADKGYIEDLPLDIAATAKKVRDGRYSIQMPDGSTQYISGLTAAQKLNLKRVEEGLPEATSFPIGEARDFLGGTVGKLAEPVVSGIPDRLQYGASLLDGKPVVFSEANEVIPGRKTTDAEKLRAGMDEDGNSVLPDYIEFQTLEEAKRYAGRLNQRGQNSRYLPPEILADKTDLTNDIKRLLDAKNITSEVSSPEIGQLVKAFTGAKNFSDMTLDDQKLFYARMRELPKLSKPAKIPVFKGRTYTPEQFVRAAQAQNQSGKMLSDTEITEAAGLEPNAKGVTDIRRELKRQNGKRFVEMRRMAAEVAPVQEALGKILSEYGIDPAILKVSTRLKDEQGRDITDQTEGFYDPRTKELALAIDSIDPEGKLTQEQRVNALAEVMSHEIIHALRATDMFTQKEWALLEAAATRTQKPGKGMTYLQWARRPVNKGGYADKSPTIQVEEAIADMARDLIGNKKVIGGKPRNLLERIIQFFTKVRNLMDGYGFTTFEDLLDAIRSGEIGRREQGVVRSLRTTEAIEEKAGYLPARYRDRMDQFRGEAPAAREAQAVPNAGAQQAVPDFDPTQLAGAQVMESRKAVESSKDWAYSPLMKAVESVSPKVTTAKQWGQWLDANAPKLGVSKDEIEFSGIKDFIALKEGKVSKDDVLAYLDQNGVQVTENQLGASADNESAIADELELYFNDESSGYDNVEFIRNSDGTITVMSDGDFVVANGMPSVVAEEYGIELDDIEGADKATRYEKYTVPGGKDYRELLLTLPVKNAPEMNYQVIGAFPREGFSTREDAQKYIDDFVSRVEDSQDPDVKAMVKAKLDKFPFSIHEYESEQSFRKNYKSGHWNEPNVLAHTRIDTRTEANGEPVLFVNEIQSDWGQEGRKKGFVGNPVTGYQVMWSGRPLMTYATKEEADAHVERAKINEPSAPVSIKEIQTTEHLVNELSKGMVNRAPFVTETKSWVALTIKRLLRYAVDNGFKKVAFINGEQAADLYDLSEQVREIAYIKKGNKYELSVTSTDGEGVTLPKESFDESELEGVVGKEIAEKIINGEGNKYRGRKDTVLEGVDLKIGGEGMKSFYDRIVPQVATDVVRKIGGTKASNMQVSIDESPGETAYEVVLPNGKVVQTTSSKRNAEATASSFDGAIVRVVAEMMGDQIGIEITPEMERNILAGQRLFSRKDLPDTIEVDGIQRPTVNSNGQQIHNTEEGVRNFWRWFGDSKVVDADGRPLVVYHGTNAEFSVFKPNSKSINSTTFGYIDTERTGIFLSDNSEFSNQYGERVMPLFASIKNPAEISRDLILDFADSIDPFGPDRNLYVLAKNSNRWALFDNDIGRRFVQFLNEKGYDGAVFAEDISTGDADVEGNTYVAFNPTQIKSAISNTGAFSPESSDIRYSRKDEVRNPNLVQRSPEVLQEAVDKVVKDTNETGKYAVPLYNPEASPEAIYVALNPDFGQKLDSEDERRYSRQNAPAVSPEAKDIMDRATPALPDETMGQSILKKMELPPIADMKDRFRQGAIFRYARLERQYRSNPELMAQLADTSAIAAIELADHARAFTQRALLYGVPAYENGTTKIKDFVHNGNQYRGLIEVMGMLYSKEHGNLEQLAHAYATAVRGERLNKEGKLSPVKPGELAILEKEVDRFVNPETGRPIIKEWFETWQTYNSNIVKYLRDTGIVDQAGADLWMKQADYIPFYREDSEGNLQFPRVFGGLHTAGQFKAVGKSDKALNVDMVSAIVGNIDAAIAMGMKNVAQQRIIRDQIKLGLASVLKQGETVGQRNSVSFKIGGKRYTAIIDDPLIYESMLPVSEIPLDGIIGQAVRAPAGLLRELIIRDPGYMIANMFRDTLSSYAVTGAEITPVVDTVRGMFSDLTNLENMGVVGGYDLRLDDGGVRKFYDKHAKEMGMVAGLDWTKPWMAIWDGMGRLSTRSEAATRLAVYNDVLARTGNEAEAQYQALSVMNYGRRGSNPLLRALTAVVPFMNARIQGLDKLYQAGRGRTGAKYDTSASGEKTRNLNNLKNFQRFFFRAALITGITALYYAMVSDDDEYKNASPEVRDGYYIIPLKKGDVASGEPGLSMRLPIPFEVGILFKVIPERLLATMYGEDTPRDIKESFWRNMTSTLAFNPIPQAVLPITEMMFNYDTFTGRPVVPTYMENLLPEQQQNFYTNQLAVKLAETETGQKLGISPMKLDHLLQGYFGTLGGYFLQALDSVARENGMVKPETTWYQKPFIKRFFTTANQPGLQNQFYDLKDYTDGITRTINDLEEQGRYDELATFYAKNGHLYEMRSTLNFLNREITALRDQRKMVETMDIDPESKRELIEQINMQIAATLTTVPMLRQEAFGPRPEIEQ